MVHALKEAGRVLKPDGLLIDLRPAAVHRRLGLGIGRNWKLVGVMRESLEEDHAANAAIRSVVADHILKPIHRVRFSLDREMDTLADLRAWLGDFNRIDKYGDHQWLIKRLQTALASSKHPRKITVRGRMTLGVLRKP